ncbi:beta-propeller fold lactonase family protein [Alloacidobacterium dinghuense]|uniref:Beta-propeller fold lactonase family protein n=1 Tax=Alloacidobacterium dinghuense TaxID=2763107 RepID=A0A7G8BJM3_9BACT|nr:beta-propeller fold lactonase family protein [Alloacidobacterium dinghuense]QNI32743.1 beta-propeller fold lactonase family protein [Alloacidobacterium dinghuense]
MLKSVPGLLAVALCLGASAATMYAAETIGGGSTSVFVMTNDKVKNEILTYQRGFDGQFALRRRVATGGRGSGGQTDPLQSQGALTISGDHTLLLAVNSASGRVSSFHLLNGVPVFIDQEYSDGAFPIAVTEHNGTVYVLNAGGSGAVVAFNADGLGRLHEIQNSSTFLTSLNSGASSISVSPNGQWLIVIEKATNSIDVFPVHPDGSLGAVVNNKSVTPGVFATLFTPTGQLIVSENQPNNGTDTSSISSYTINANGSLTPVSQSLPTFGNGNCWNAITPNGKWVYVDNAGTFTVAGFSIASSSALTPIANTILRTLPDGATNLDMAISGDGEYLFNLQSGAGVIGVYTINPDGTLNQLGDIEGLPKTAGFNGIAAL